MDLAEAALSDSACYLVDVTIGTGNTIVVEIDHDEAVSIDDCVALSQYIEAHLDRDAEDYDEGGITLTVDKKVKPEGARRKTTVYEDETYRYDEIAYAKNKIRFK